MNIENAMAESGVEFFKLLGVVFDCPAASSAGLIPAADEKLFM